MAPYSYNLTSQVGHNVTVALTDGPVKPKSLLRYLHHALCAAVQHVPLHPQALLRLVGLVFLIAFTSYWVQLPGLYGNDGLEPAEPFLQRQERVMGSRQGLVGSDTARTHVQPNTKPWCS